MFLNRDRYQFVDELQFSCRYTLLPQSSPRLKRPAAGRLCGTNEETLASSEVRNPLRGAGGHGGYNTIKVPQWYVVQVSDTTMMPIASLSG